MLVHCLFSSFLSHPACAGSDEANHCPKHPEDDRIHVEEYNLCIDDIHPPIDAIVAKCTLVRFAITEDACTPDSPNCHDNPVHEPEHKLGH